MSIWAMLFWAETGPLFWVDWISRVVHISTAIALVGGSLFLALVLLPAARVLAEDAHRQLADAVQGRWRKLVHGGIALFLLSGFYNYFRAMPKHDGDGLYHALVGVKILLALFVFFLASALVGRSAALESFRQAKARWLRVLIVVAAVIVAISGFVKIRGVPESPPEVAPVPETALLEE